MKEIEQKDEIILIVKDAISANARMTGEDTFEFDGNDVDHIADEVADNVLERGYLKDCAGYSKQDIENIKILERCKGVEIGARKSVGEFCGKLIEWIDYESDGRFEIKSGRLKEKIQKLLKEYTR